MGHLSRTRGDCKAGQDLVGRKHTEEKKDTSSKTLANVVIKDPNS